jgi:hypothetical protein
MTTLLSPEYNFQVFCYQVQDKDPLQIMEAASAEAALARKLHRRKTNNPNFRPGSKGDAYCTQLQNLISTLMNGSIPTQAPPTFREEIRPLMVKILENWSIGNLRQEFMNNNS